MRKRRALYSLYLFVAIFLLLGGLALARPMLRNGCICWPHGPVMKSTPPPSIDRVPERAQVKQCCEK